MSKNGMMAAVAAAAGIDEEKAAHVTVDAGFIAQHFPAIAEGFKADGAKAERERIAGIDKAAMPGHEKLIAEMKADGSKTPADAALAVIAAEKAKRESVSAGLDADEAKMKGLRSEPANGAATAETEHKPKLTGEAAWKAEFAAKADLQSEFQTEARYLAFKSAEASGRVRILTNKSA